MLKMNLHRIHRVAKITGLSKDVIRVWERRYGLLKPVRGANRYRNYSDEDIAVLRYIKSELDRGASIGALATLGRDTLLARIQQRTQTVETAEAPFDSFISELIATLGSLDQSAFERRLNGAVAVIPFEEALDRILLPLQVRIGELWHQGRITEATEHYVTKLVQKKLFAAMNNLPIGDGGLKIVVACPPGELHEVGAQTVAYRCRLRGCSVYYLGPDVPAAALVSFATQTMPDLVFLSFPVAFPQEALDSLLSVLATNMRDISPIKAGGNGALAMKHVFAKHSFSVLADFTELVGVLSALSKERSSPSS